MVIAENYKLNAEGYIDHLNFTAASGFGSKAARESVLQSKAKSKSNNKHRKNENHFCTNCKKRYHTYKTCFAAGGGDEANRPSWFRIYPENKKRAHVTAGAGGRRKETDHGREKEEGSTRNDISNS